jgi:bacteriocin-type transport-associated protein
MKKVLFILGELKDVDIDWLISAGRRETVPAGHVLIREGSAINALYIVLDGQFSVTIKALGDTAVARLSTGEVIGEISFVDERPPSATVTALEPARVLAIPRAAVQAKLLQDDGFAARFYRALAVFLSDRLRSTVSHLGYGKATEMDENVEYEDELDLGVLDKVALAGARFDWLLRRLQGG